MSDALAGVRALLIDLDGVLYVEDEAIAGAREAVGELREAGLGLRFVTNTTARSRPQTLAKLDRLGFDVAEAELVTPAALARRHCAQAGHRRVALIMNEEVKADFEGFEETDEGPDAVIMGDLGEAFGFAILNRAFRMVMDGGELIALQKNRFWLTGEGLSLDAGPFVAAIEYATGKEAIVVGKPSASFFDLVLGDLGVAARRRGDGGRRRRVRHRRRPWGWTAGDPRTHREVPRGLRRRVGDRADGDGRHDRRRSGAARPRDARPRPSRNRSRSSVRAPSSPASRRGRGRPSSSCTG